MIDRNLPYRFLRGQPLKGPSTSIMVFLAFRPHENGLFGHQKHWSAESGPQSGLLKTPTFRLRVDGRKQRFSIDTMMSYIICWYHCVCSVRDAIVFQLFPGAFLCGQAKKIQIRCVWTRMSDTSEQDLIVFNLKNKNISTGKCGGLRIYGK